MFDLLMVELGVFCKDCHSYIEGPSPGSPQSCNDCKNTNEKEKC